MTYDAPMPTGPPGRAKQWLIAALANRGLRATPSKVERLYRAGLAPEPHRPWKDAAPADLWPRGAVDHYAAAVPLLRQRHHCIELAALTLLGWGYPIAKEPLARGYTEMLTPDNPEDAIDRVVERRRKHPVPFLGQFARHLRSAGHTPADTEDLVVMTAGASLAFLTGAARSREQLALLLIARFGPQFAALAPEVADFALNFMSSLAPEFSGPALLASIRRHTVDDLLAAQPTAAKLVDDDLSDLNGWTDDCPMCAEGRAILIALNIPALLRAEELDWNALIADI
jgi:hypothetical protein